MSAGATTIHEQARHAAEWHSSQSIRRANRSKLECAYWEHLDWSLRFYEIAVAIEARATEGGGK